MSMMMSQITSFTFVYSTVYSGIDQRKHQKLCITGLFTENSPVTGEFPAQGPKMQKMFPFDDVNIWYCCQRLPRQKNIVEFQFLLCLSQWEVDISIQISSWTSADRDCFSNIWVKHVVLADLIAYIIIITLGKCRTTKILITYRSC